MFPINNIQVRTDEGCESGKDHKLCNQHHEQSIDNSSTVLEKIASLYAERLLSDITLEVSGKIFAAHRLILCASSDVFQVMLMSPSWSESKETRIVLQEDPHCCQVFGDFLHYLYTGKVKLTYQTALPLVALADKYNVRDLVEICIAYICRHVVTASTHGKLISWLQYTQVCGHAKVHAACRDFIAWNFEQVAQSPDFGSLEEDLLLSFLTHSDLVVRDEITLFYYVAKWLETQEQRMAQSGDFGNLVCTVMGHIRFPMMTPRQLASLLLHPFTSRFKDFLVEQMRVAMAFQQYHTVERSVSCNHYTPRLYTAETWSVPLSIENYNLLPVYGVRTLLFSTPTSLAEGDTGSFYEWVLDIFPKGVCFKRFYLIVWQGTVEMPEYVYRTVRLSLTLKDTVEEARVKIGILICSMQDGVEYIQRVAQRVCVFTAGTRMVNIDDLIPYDELNDFRTFKSPFLIGPNGDCLKLQIVITPYTFT